VAVAAEPAEPDGEPPAPGAVPAGGAADRRPAVLVLRALGLGDLLTAVPALRGVRRAYPDHRLVLAGPAALAPLALLTGAVGEVLPAPTPGEPGHLRPPAWRGPPPALAVNLHGRGPRSGRALLALRPGRLLGYRHPAYPQVDGPPWREDEPERERWCGLLAYCDIAADPADLDLSRPADPPPSVPGAVVVHPGAAYPARRWPPDRFAAVAAALRDAGHRVVLTGGPAERELAAGIAAAAGLPPGAVLAGRTGPLDLAALVADARLVVCGDTGVGHLATAYRTPSVLLFGPTSPARWGPPPDRAGRHTVLWPDGTPGDPWADRPDPTLLRIRPADVLAAAADLLGEPRPDSRRAASATAAP
jgi:ADP-heptose:LPS heptosyltransferase